MEIKTDCLSTERMMILDRKTEKRGSSNIWRGKPLLIAAIVAVTA